MSEKYAGRLRLIHWLMAALVIAMLCIGYYMTSLPNATPEEAALKYGTFYKWHKSFGLLILFLVMVRLVVRLTSAVPPPPASHPAVLRVLGRISHLLLYTLLFAMPILGYLSNSFHPSIASVWFFGIDLPFFTGKDEELFKTLIGLHKTLAWVFVILIVVHLGAALKHRFFDGPEDDVIKRII